MNIKEVKKSKENKDNIKCDSVEESYSQFECTDYGRSVIREIHLYNFGYYQTPKRRTE